MRRVIIAAACVVGTVVVVASAQQLGSRPTYWPLTKGDPVVQEWYSDIPWQQKLGTFAGTQINQAIVMPYGALGKTDQDPACDFLMHDGRACDAIEAAFIHDGPAISKLRVIQGPNASTANELRQLRAFLYSL